MRLVRSAEARTESRMVPIGDHAGVIRQRLELGPQPLSCSLPTAHDTGQQSSGSDGLRPVARV